MGRHAGSWGLVAEGAESTGLDGVTVRVDGLEKDIMCCGIQI